jgi:hypothetical protein
VGIQQSKWAQSGLWPPIRRDSIGDFEASDEAAVACFATETNSLPEYFSSMCASS